MPHKKRKQSVADRGSSKDTVFRRVATFLPLLVPVRQAKEACEEPRVSFWDAITGRAPASPQDVVLSSERDFVVGGQHTGARNPLRHWVLDEDGMPRRAAESPLGAPFDAYFETLPAGLQAELIADKSGIHAERWVSESHRVAVGKGSAVLTGNSGKVAEHIDAAIEKVTEGLHSGQYRCLGTIEDWHAEHGCYPMTGGLSIEPEKPRLVTDPLEVNKNTTKQAVDLEGLNEVRENVRWAGDGEAPWQVGHDQKSGYNNLLLSEGAQALFMFAFLGYIFTEMTLPYGWLNAAYCQQRGGILAMGFMRYLGTLGSMYLDDSHLSSGLQTEPRSGPPGKLMHWEARMYSDLQYRLGQQSYALEVLLAYYFGVWLSWERKCNRRPTRRLVVLGMVCDTLKQAFIIPDEKRRRYVELGRGLIKTLEGNRVIDFYATGRFAGQTMGFWHALPRARLYLTPLYSLITDAELVGDKRAPDAMTRSAWWRKVHGTTTRTVRGEWYEAVLEALRDLCRIVGHPDERDAVVYSFVRERHMKVELRVYHDATLSSWGIYADGLGSDGGLLEEGGELPETLCGVQLAGRNTGTTEIGAVLQSLLGMVRVVAVLATLKSHRVCMMMDNLENVLSMNGYKVSGIQRVGKYVIVRAIFELLDLHGIAMSFEHVDTKSNKSDRASREESFREVRTSKAVFDMLYATVGRFTVDLMSSVSCAQVSPVTGLVLRYYSRWCDAGCAGVNVLRQNVRVGPNGERELAYVFPPLAMEDVMYRYILEARANAVIISRVGGQQTGSQGRMDRYVVSRRRLPAMFAEKRGRDGWALASVGAYEAVHVEFP